MNKKKIIIITMILVLVVIVVLWISGIIPKQIARVSTSRTLGQGAFGFEEYTEKYEKTENTNNLTLDKLKEMIAEKGANLTWSDFKDYSSTDVGFGLYILLYKINEDYNLYIGGYNEKEEPLYIRLVSTKDENRFIDIREDNIDDFLSIKS